MDRLYAQIEPLILSWLEQHIERSTVIAGLHRLARLQNTTPRWDGFDEFIEAVLRRIESEELGFAEAVRLLRPMVLA